MFDPFTAGPIQNWSTRDLKIAVFLPGPLPVFVFCLQLESSQWFRWIPALSALHVSTFMQSPKQQQGENQNPENKDTDKPLSSIARKGFRNQIISFKAYKNQCKVCIFKVTIWNTFSPPLHVPAFPPVL